MTLAVNLDRQLVFVNHKISHIRPDRRLLAHMNSVQTPELSQLTPELALALSHVATQPASAGDCVAHHPRGHRQYPHP